MPSDKAVGFSAAGISPCRSVASLQSAPLQPHTAAADAADAASAAPAATVASAFPRRVTSKRHSIPHRIGFALASTGAKMAVVPALGSALRRLSIRRRDAPRSTRTVAIQTEAAVAAAEAEADPLQSAAALNSFLRAQRRSRSAAAAAAAAAVCCPLSAPLRRHIGTAPLASAESLFDASELPAARRMQVPQILEQQASSSDLELDSEAGAANQAHCLLSVQPVHGLSRKSSTGDSAVDLKFSEDDRGALSPSSGTATGDDVFDVSLRSRRYSPRPPSQAEEELQEHLADMMLLLDDDAVKSPLSCSRRPRKTEDGEEEEEENMEASRSSYDFSSSFSGSFSPSWPPSLALKGATKDRAASPREKGSRSFRSGRSSEGDGPRRPFQRSWSTSSWRKLRNVVIWTPFMQQYKRHKYPWIQLAGHEDNFHPGEQGSVLKKFSERENVCLQALAHDVLRSFVPEYRGTVEKHGNQYIRMQDLLLELDSPSLMDCKIGVRTYLEDELSKAKTRPPRKDLYEKMIGVDASAPTPEEHGLQAVFKPRYMQWRESISSTSNLGFRIEGIKKSIGTSSRDFKKTKQREDVKECLRDFTDGNLRLLNGYLTSLHALHSTLEVSSFFQSHEVIGSSLLFIHDRCGHARVWLIDFGNTTPLPPGLVVDHRSPWTEGNHEDGYLFGLSSLIALLTELRDEARDAFAAPR